MMTVTTATAEGEKRSFKDKMKFFEQEIEEQKVVKPRQGGRKFSYLNEHEVQNIRKEEERKMSLMSQEELLQQFNSAHGEDQTFDMVMKSLAGDGSRDKKAPPPIPSKIRGTRSPEAQYSNTSLTGSLTRSLHEGSSSKQDTDSYMNTAQRRALEEEKRAALRAARMKSLEDDANRAQAVIARVSKTKTTTETEPQQYKSNGSAENEVDPCTFGNTEYSSLSVNMRLSEPTVKESSRVLGERVNRRVEEVYDPTLGRHVFRTVEYVEKVVETEIETTRQQIVELEVSDKQPSSSNPL